MPVAQALKSILSVQRLTETKWTQQIILDSGKDSSRLASISSSSFFSFQSLAEFGRGLQSVDGSLPRRTRRRAVNVMPVFWLCVTVYKIKYLIK